jgi:hypothetical protein
VPLLLSQSGADASVPTSSLAVPAAMPGHRVATRPPTQRPASTTKVPTVARVVIAAAPVRQVIPITTVPPTTTTVPPTTTTTTTTTTTLAHPSLQSRSGNGSRGDVTYYDHPAGHCASPWLPFGTMVTVTNPDNGATVTCLVDDREADTARSIDLATSTFALIAPLSQGVVNAILHW